MRNLTDKRHFSANGVQRIKKTGARKVVRPPTCGLLLKIRAKYDLHHEELLRLPLKETHKFENGLAGNFCLRAGLGEIRKKDRNQLWCSFRVPSAEIAAMAEVLGSRRFPTEGLGKGAE